MGSLSLLWKLHGMHLVSLGTAITVIAIGFGPFAQQVVIYPLQLHPVGSAYVPQVFNFTGSALNAGEVSPYTLAAMEEGIAPGNFTLSTIAPSCNTGNCTWAQYSSLGVCASVSDLSSTIINSTCNITSFEEIFDIADIANPGYPCFNYSLPRISYISNTNDPGSQSDATLSNGVSDALIGQAAMEIMTLSPGLDNSSTIGNLYLLFQPDFTANSTGLPSPIAYGLNLNLCIQTYNTTVSNGIVNTTVLSSQILDTPVEQSFDPSNNSFTDTNNDSYVSIGGITFGVSAQAQNLLLLAATEYGGECYVFPDQEWQADDIDSAYYCDTATALPFLEVLLNSTDPLSAITEIGNNLAISMTNAFRTGAGGDTQWSQFEGIALVPIAFVKTNYLWLILPISLVTLTGIFLIATILKSQRLGSRVLKSSNFATLQGLHGELHTQLGGLSLISEMEQKAKEIEVKFDIDLKGVKTEHVAEYRLVQSK